MKLGIIDIDKLYLGNTEVEKAYLGTTEVFKKGSSRLPDGYQELHYVYSHNRAGFKVPFNVHNSTPGFELNFMRVYTTTDYCVPIGVYGNSNGYNLCFDIFGNNNSTVMSIRAASGVTQNINVNYNGTMQTVKYINNVLTRCDGTTVTYTFGFSSSQTNYIGIGNQWREDLNSFGIGSARTFTIRFGNIKLYYGSTIQYDFIPCKRLSDGKIGFFDSIGRQFYSTETEEEFNAGPAMLPEGYQELQYITSNKHRSGFKVVYTIGANSGFVLRYHSYVGEENNTKFNSILGMYDSSASYTSDAGIGRSAVGSSLMDGIERIFGNYPSSNSGDRLNTDVGFVRNGNYIQECSLLNGVVTTCSGTQVNRVWNCNNPYITNKYCGIFTQYQINNSSLMLDDARGTVTIAYLALYIGSDKSYEFIPCKRISDNKPGMYDLVNGVFHASETGTDFVAGPPV